MPSQSKSQTARANGAKSRGPVTPEGRAKSSRNSVRDGLRAKSIVLPTESTAEFESLRDSYLDQFHPQTGVETELVEAMAVARWRLRRICTIETNLLTNEMLRRAGAIEEEFEEMDCDVDHDDSLTWVFKRLADNGQTLALLVRYEGALHRSYDKAFKQLLMLQSMRNRPQPNEPTADPLSSPVQASSEPGSKRARGDQPAEGSPEVPRPCIA